MQNNYDLPAYPRTLNIVLDDGIDFTNLESSDVVHPNQKKTANARCLLVKYSREARATGYYYESYMGAPISYTTTMSSRTSYSSSSRGTAFRMRGS